jgi:hypothetical protein
VATEAGLGRWKAGEGGFLNCRVAVPAINTETAYVVTVTEWDRLLAVFFNARRIRRQVQCRKRESDSRNSKDA